MTNEPIECSAYDKAAANEAFDYCLFALRRHGIDIAEDDKACSSLLLAILRSFKKD